MTKPRAHATGNPDIPLDHGKSGVQPIGTVAPYPPPPTMPTMKHATAIGTTAAVHVPLGMAARLVRHSEARDIPPNDLAFLAIHTYLLALEQGSKDAEQGIVIFKRAKATKVPAAKKG